MNKELKKRAITPAELEEIYGIPRGSAATYKVGGRRVIYMIEDVE